jgi:hypothetical protein
MAKKTPKKTSKLVSFNSKPHSKIIRIEKSQAEKMHLKSPRRLKATDFRMSELVKKVVAALDKPAAKKPRLKISKIVVQPHQKADLKNSPADLPNSKDQL